MLLQPRVDPQIQWSRLSIFQNRQRTIRFKAAMIIHEAILKIWCYLHRYAPGIQKHQHHFNSLPGGLSPPKMGGGIGGFGKEGSGEQAEFPGDTAGLGAAVDVQLVVDILGVPVNGTGRNNQFPGDLLVGKPHCD